MSWARIGEILDRQAAGASDETKRFVGGVLPTVASETVRSTTGSNTLSTAADAAVRAATNSEKGQEMGVKVVDALTFGLGSTILDKLFGK